MKKFFQKTLEKLQEIDKLPRDVLLYRNIPHFVIDLISKYLRVEMEGLEHIPEKGPVLFTPNHSGYSGFDAVILGHELFKRKKIIARILTHHLWFVSKATALPANKMGFVEASSQNGLHFLRKNKFVVLFPEGEFGNFKVSSKKYQLQDFKRGFVRMALQTEATIIPTLIIGAEETHINLKELKLNKFLRGLTLPLPFNIIPLPAKWKIIFLEPIKLPYKPEAANHTELVHEISNEIREKMQNALTIELAKREYVYFKNIY